MKILTSFVLACLAAPAFAGSGKEVVAEPQPQPSLLEWFAGASVGYLTEFEEPMYHLHVGQDTNLQLGGWDFAWFLEIGYAEKEESGGGSTLPVLPPSFDLDELEQALALTSGSYDLSIMPVTINGKFERSFAQNWNVYAGAGIGMAQVDLDVSPGIVSDDDWVFTAQVFTGVQYDINESWEVYGGARWMYFDDAEIGAFTLELEDDFLLELGARYNF